MTYIIYKKVKRRVGRVLPVLLLTLLPLSAWAQVGEYRTDFAVGINGGYVLNTIGFQPDVPQNNMGGMTAGLTFRYTCEKYFKSICAIVAEVNYSQLGWKEDILDIDDNAVYYADDPDMTNPLTYERRINYIQIPLMARMGWGRERKGLQAFFQIGPQVGIYTSESTKTNVDLSRQTLTARTSNIVAQETMPVEKKLDYGIAGGAGIEFSVPRVGHFLLDGRYYYGLGNIYKNSKSDYFGKSNHGSIVVKLTYLYDIVKTKNPKIK